MQCPKCHFQNPPEAKFCGRCGETLKPAVTPRPNDGVSQELKIGIAAGSILFGPLGIIMGATYLNDPNPQKKKVGQLWLFLGLGATLLQCVLGYALFYWYDNY